MNIKPLHNNVLIEPLLETEGGRATESGIIIPDTADKEKPIQGRVVEVGPGKTDENGNLIKMSVSVGQKVVFSKPYSAEEIKIDNKKYFIMSEENILAVIE